MARTMDVVTYNPQWKQMYQDEENLLRDIFGNKIVEIHHFGSTSVEGLSSKPIIDIMIFVKKIDEIDSYNSKMESSGYVVRGENGEPNRRYFVKMKSDASGNHSHHIHIFQMNNLKARDELLFRDYLKINEFARQKYNDLKIILSQKHYTDPISYTNGKTECVNAILEEAKIYFNSR